MIGRTHSSACSQTLASTCLLPRASPAGFDLSATLPASNSRAHRPSPQPASRLAPPLRGLTSMIGRTHSSACAQTLASTCLLLRASPAGFYLSATLPASIPRAHRPSPQPASRLAPPRRGFTSMIGRTHSSACSTENQGGLALKNDHLGCCLFIVAIVGLVYTSISCCLTIREYTTPAARAGRLCLLWARASTGPRTGKGAATQLWATSSKQGRTHALA